MQPPRLRPLVVAALGLLRRVGRLRAGSRALPGERPASGTPSARPLCRLTR
jgi:hypothetical protein